MTPYQDHTTIGCAECTKGAGLGFDFTMAFQPIVNTTTKEVFAQEALVRGINQEPAGEILARINDDNRYRFDQACRVKAVQLGAKLNIKSFVSINFLPNAVYRPELCIRTTLEAAETFGFPVDRIIFEITEGEKIEDHGHLREIVQYYRQQGFLTAIDDFGAGYSGLNLLAEFQTDLVKLDMGLIRHIDQNKGRKAIVKGIIQVCKELDIKVIAEGVETYEELNILQSFGIELFQGYYFAKPKFQGLAALNNL
ncbi:MULTISPECIES: EAL domain-containing protein [Pseudanabaena]|jgi:EAL domain-containing protein (putative c-di-GMP-specific phosphodiesterase class I)|uniref:EAL domain-containing protein n=1 Tax=Pseudanabaena TaxID=1152 RepID=UPI002479A6F1|nr:MULTISPECIES: EAL domain-containing protein [Pseudanabaena]MEA5490040.1 EAL domain-containing protein [Pseudanabaena sp. CCNP1317]WGS71837.1 EAL domain-containing protein [Pseudanabaena galeata CCNP1313]